MSGGSVVKAAVGKGGSPVLAATKGSEKRGTPRGARRAWSWQPRGPQAPHSKRKEISRRLAGSSCVRDRYRMDETANGGSGSTA